VDAISPPFSARSRVHEYGGSAYTVHRGRLFFSNFADQRLYRVDAGGSDPVAITPDEGDVRFADAAVTPGGGSLVCVRERHGGDGVDAVVNDLVEVPAEGGEPVQLVGGHDFFAAPRVSPDGRHLAWLCWDHPNMPWDGTELWVADLPGAPNPRPVAGGRDESISQPRWSPDGRLHWISDRSGWWNLYREGDTASLAPMEAEFARPDWVFGQSTYTFLSDGRVAATWSRDGISHLGLVADGTAHPIDVPFTDISALQTRGTRVVAIAASGRQPAAVVEVDVDTAAVTVLKASRGASLPDAAVSEARPITYPTEGGTTAHAFFYPPRLDGFEGPAGERPPLVVRSHGGPTGAASPALNVEIQFWTSRGVAVVDVDYGGSSGYGREYRRRLDGRWGIVDLDDCVNAALHLAREGEVDGRRLAVRGGSAGGYTTLCALTFRDIFATGASYYGVSDLETLATDTHKFESRYLDRLIGPYPRDKEVYRQRSPIHFAERVRVPVILLQGLEDKVVPPSQAEVFVEALRAKRVPFAYLTFEGEQHGFRQAPTIRRAIEAELWFYGRVLGFEPADRLDPVPVENGDRL
jgi:dipeptidyl aminopeptidase/acylaminoacyl peptidase